MTERRIVIGYDGSPGAQWALRWGLREAARLRAAAELVYAWAWPNYLPAASMIPGTPVWPDLAAESAVDHMLDSAKDRAGAEFPGVPVTVVAEHGPAVTVLQDRSAGAALAVVGGRSHGAVAGFLLGSVAGSLAAHAPCTVVVVREPAPLSAAGPVLLGLDESGHAERATRFAFEQAAAEAVPLHVVRAWMPPPDPWIGSQFVDREEIAIAERVAVREQLAPWRDKYPSVSVRIDTVVGHPYRVIAEASAEARMVVLGARGRGGFAGLRLGSVSRYALNHVLASIAIVR